MDNNKEFGWRKMPVSWQKDPEFQQRIRAASQGTAIAALKIYLAICLKAEFHETDRLPAGSAQLSLTTLCELLDLSRPMVVDGLKLLVEWNIVARIGGRPTILQIVGFDEPPYWVKLPKRPLYGSKSENAIQALMQLPNRKRSSLHALQLYLYLASIRDKHTNMAKLSYDQGAVTLGVSRNHFSSAVSLLAAVGLLTVRTALEIKQQTGQNFSSNQYWLRGSSHDPYRASPAEAGFKGIEIDDTSFEEFLGDHDSGPQRSDRSVLAANVRLRRSQELAAVFEDD
ncbi:hypothetical protein CSQ93_08385 [Janthinobacterium sp. BJB426]|uniref:hypothetical protein n=1 Tax=Janthinobacterium sp. BJB426 TaxID=2048010 RepID=UPI000C0E4ECA|nr:hypothetical protein [Janthinobacterium sp. BJB426]PHV28327.1 hypothetical protein CSQ93_08385 [Janthinobacterium sp. BJB426]